jgi:hypothetical protein
LRIVERCFRGTKNTIEARPVSHHRDDSTLGHIVGSFLAPAARGSCEAERGAALAKWLDGGAPPR